MEKENKKLPKSKKRIALITVVCILAAIVFVVIPVLTVIIYNDNFGERFETAEWMAFSVDEF